MKKLIVVFIVAVLLASFLVGCGHTHEWNDATCTAPKTCSVCGKTEGSPLGHDWKDATCTEPKTCIRCGATEGSLADHDFQFERKEEATCSKPGYSVYACSGCSATDIRDKVNALGHDWKEATCTEPKTCARCGRSEGSPAGHNAPDLTCTSSGVCLSCGEELTALGHDWKAATCTEPETCTRCGETEGEALGHTPAEAKTEKQKTATCTEDGQHDIVVYCSVCKSELSRETIVDPALGHTTASGVCTRCGFEVYAPITGRGDDVISNIEVGDGLYKAHITYSGEHVFSVWIYNKDDYRDLAVNEMGSYDGYVYLYGSAPYTFEVESHGNWSITIERIGTTDDNSFTGKGDYVTDIFSGSTGTWHISHDGDHVFSIWLYTTDGRDLIVNELGEYDGRRRLTIPTGSKAFLVIEADGKWSIEPAD